MSQPIAFVTGASSGMGNAIARQLSTQGFKVYGTCRKPASYVKKELDSFEMVRMDVLDQVSIDAAASEVLEREGRVDVLVCAAGMGIAGSVEDTTIEEIQLQMDTNFLGVVRTIKAFLPSMRQAQAGRIVVIGSIAGLIGVPYQAFYSTSKFALEGLVEALRLEISPFKVQVTLLDPGDFSTGFVGSRLFTAGAKEGPYKKHFDVSFGIALRDEMAAGHAYPVATGGPCDYL